MICKARSVCINSTFMARQDIQTLATYLRLLQCAASVSSVDACCGQSIKCENAAYRPLVVKRNFSTPCYWARQDCMSIEALALGRLQTLLITTQSGAPNCSRNLCSSLCSDLRVL